MNFEIWSAVQLIEPLEEAGRSRVIVMTWVQPAQPIDLRTKGIDEVKRLIYAAG